MAKDYDDIGGVWRTIGGRRVFIKTGQSLSEAMIESGKFKNLRSTYQKDKEKSKEEQKDHTFEMNDEEKKKYEMVGKKIDNLTKEIEKEKVYEGQYEKISNDIKGLDRRDAIEIVNKELDNGNITQVEARKLQNEIDKVEQGSVWEKQPDGTFLANKDAMKKQYEENHKNYDAKIKQFAEDRKNMTNGDWEGMLMAYEKQNADGTYKTLQDIMDDVNKYEEDNKSIKQLNNEMLGNKYKGNGETPSLVYSNGRRIDIANNENGGKTATIWKDGKIERKTNLPENVKGDKTKDYFDKYLKELDDKEQGFTSQSTNPFYPDKEYSQEDLKRMADNGVKPMKNTYSGNGWEGVNSDKNLSTSEQAKAITDTMKEKYPDVKISRKSDVYSGGSSITFSVMSSDKDLYISDKDIDNMPTDQLYNSEITRGYGFERWANENVPNYKQEHTFTDKDVRNYAKSQLSQLKERDNQSVRGDEWYLSNYGKQVMSDLNKEADSYTYDDSDAMTDYFNHGTYMWVNIGKWDKPYQVNAKATGETINNTIRQKAYQKYLKEHPGSKMTFDDFKDMKK